MDEVSERIAANLTAQFLGDPTGWDAVTVQLSSVQPLWGGLIVGVAAPESATVRRISLGARHERRYQVTLRPGERAALLRLLIEHDLLAIELPQRAMLVPDEAETLLTVRKGPRAFTLTTWANDPADARVSAIAAALRGLERRTEGLTPIYDGPYHL